MAEKIITYRGIDLDIYSINNFVVKKIETLNNSSIILVIGKNSQMINNNMYFPITNASIDKALVGPSKISDEKVKSYINKYIKLDSSKTDTSSGNKDSSKGSTSSGNKDSSKTDTSSGNKDSSKGSTSSGNNKIIDYTTLFDSNNASKVADEAADAISHKNSYQYVIGTDILKNNETANIYIKDDIEIDKTKKDSNGFPDFYSLKNNAKPKYTLKTGDVVRCYYTSESKKFAIIIKVLPGSNNNYFGEEEKMKGLYLQTQITTVNVDGETFVESTVRDATKEDIQNTSVKSFTDALNSLYELIGENYTSDDFLVKYEYDEVDYTSLNDESAIPSLKIQDITYIYGSPHQFLPRTDVRIDSNTSNSTNNIGNNDSIGRVYSEKILRNMPILYITPGTPDFLSQYSKDHRKTIVDNLIYGISNTDLDTILNGSGGRYYSLKFDYASYFNYVNAMLRAAVTFLNIGDETYHGNTLSSFNWANMTNKNDNGASVNKQSDEGIIKTIARNIAKGLGIEGLLGGVYGTLAFYADAGDQIDDSFSNSTTQSNMLNSLNSLSDQAKEIEFVIGTVGANVGQMATDLSNTLSGTLNGVSNIVTGTTDTLVGSGSLLSNIINKARTLISGGRMIFPEIWSDSSYSRSYNFRMKLVSPSGDKLSLFLNILVPLYHLLALTLPRQSVSVDGYFSPFLIRAYSKGLFNIDLGIITDLSITKGAEGEWTVHGIPTVAEISFTIKELYNNMAMSVFHESYGDAGAGRLNILSNIAELDYIANSCGLNVNEQDTFRIIKLASIYLKAVVTDIWFQDIVLQYDQMMSNARLSIFGKF